MSDLMKRAAVVLCLVAGGWLAHAQVYPSPQSPPPVADLTPRVAALEGGVKTLVAEVVNLATRLKAVEDALKTQPTPPTPPQPATATDPETTAAAKAYVRAYMQAVAASFGDRGNQTWPSAKSRENDAKHAAAVAFGAVLDRKALPLWDDRAPHGAKMDAASVAEGSRQARSILEALNAP